jgi:predicted transcriptional regulator
MRGFGHLEREVMRAIWRAEQPVTGREIANSLATHQELAYTTVITVVDRLREKGYLGRRRDGRSYRYHPLVAEEDYASALMEQVLDDSEDRSGALLRFAGRLTAEEADALRTALQRRGE